MSLLTVPKAAREAGCGEDRIRRAIKDGALKASRVGNYWLIEPAALRQWQQPTAPGRPELIRVKEPDWGAS